MGVVRLSDKEVKAHEPEALDGWRVTEILRDWGMFVPPRCTGSGRGGMCHIKLSDEWMDKMVPPEQMEKTMISLLAFHDKNSRLSCPILWTDALDGLTVPLP